MQDRTFVELTDHPVVARFIKTNIGLPEKGARALDVGSGPGTIWRGIPK